MNEKSEKLIIKEGRRIANRSIGIIEMTLESFGIQAKVVEIHIEDNYILFDIAFSVGTRVSQIVSLKDDLTLALSAPGKVDIYPLLGRDLIEIKAPTGKIKLKKVSYKIITRYKDLPRVSDLTRFRMFVGDILKLISRFFAWLAEKM